MSKYNQPDPRNDDTYIYVHGELLKRDEAKISVLDSAVQGGDAVWEGLRVYDSGIFQLNEHIERLIHSAHAMLFADIPSFEEIRDAIFKTLKANGMRDGVHIRLTLTRGKKSTSGMNPELNTFGSCLIVLPEYKPLVYGKEGIKLITSSIRRNPPQCIDSKIHHNNLINNILAKIEANLAEVDDAIMLDMDGFVAETNATNLFMVKKEVLYTPSLGACLPGLTRQKILELAADLDILARETRLTITDFYTADEVFTTGTMGALSHVVEIDGRKTGGQVIGPLTTKLQEAYQKAVKKESVGLTF